MGVTKLDVLTALAVALFVGFVIVMILGPMRVIAKERDIERAEHVRILMSSVLQLENEDPQKFAGLVEQLKGTGDGKVLIGSGNCAGAHGEQCADPVTSNACLNLREYVGEELLPAIPVDPNDQFSSALPGYYLAVFQNQLEVGSCGATTRQVQLRHALD